MLNKIVIVGAGFAGVWSALAAKRLASLIDKKNDIQVLVIAPEPSLIMRPRLFFQGTAEKIDTVAHAIQVRSSKGIEATIDYDRLILATGSSVVRPHGISGIEKNVFDVDSLMSCQHALQLGRVSGHNAAADLLGEPLIEYVQAAYNCCLDLGTWGSCLPKAGRDKSG